MTPLKGIELIYFSSFFQFPVYSTCNSINWLIKIPGKCTRKLESIATQIAMIKIHCKFNFEDSRMTGQPSFRLFKLVSLSLNSPIPYI